MQSKAKTVKEYIDSLPEDRRVIISTIDKLVRKAAPSLIREGEVGMMYGMIGYGKFHYKSSSGREGDWVVIGLASQKNYVSVYICAADPKEGYIAENNKHRLGKVSVGRSCIRFKKLQDINLVVLEELIKQAAIMYKEGKLLI